MNCWQILNIAPTNDERAVKRAYAGLLKTTRPDDDAAAYQRLRQAFEDALAAAPYVGADEEDGDAWMFDEWDEAEETAYPDEAEQAQRPSENGEAFENAAYGFSDGHASELCTADEFIARLHHIHRLADGRGLLKLWPQLAAQLAALNEEEERARAAAHLAEWLERPHGLPKKLQTLWRKECRMAGLDIRPSENETGGSGNSVSDGFDTQYQAIAAQLEAWYEAGGLSMLMRRRRQTFAFFNAFAPEECERLEQETFRFLLRHQLADSPLRQHWREYFRRRAAGQSSVSPEYGAQAGAAGFAQATQYLHEYGGNGGFDAGGDPLAFAERCYAVGGSNALAQSWPTLHEILDGLPLGAAQELSPQFADFLRLRNIIHPLLWLQWADYFHWDEDVHGRIITPAETQQLTHYRRLARLTGGDGGADLAGFPVSDGLAATPSPHDAEGGTESPRYTRAFDRFLGSSPGFWRRFRAVCAVMVVWPELSGETDEDERAALAVFRPALARLLEWGGEWRGAWLIVMVSAFLTFGVWGYSVGESEPAGIQLLFAGLAAAAVALAASAAYMLGLGALFYVPLLGRFLSDKWSAVKYSAKAAPVYLFTLPALFAVLLPFSERYGEGTPAEFLLFCVLAAGWTYYFLFFSDKNGKNDNINWILANLPLTGLGLWIAKTDGGLPAQAACILWFNAALYLLFAHMAHYARAVRFIRRAACFQTASLPLRPFAALAAGVLWILLLPAHAARAAIAGQYGLIFETAAAALILLLFLPESVPQLGLLLYPALLLVVWLRTLASALILRLLEKSPAPY